MNTDAVNSIFVTFIVHQFSKLGNNWEGFGGEKRENKSEQWFGAVVKSGGPGGDIIVSIVFSLFNCIIGISIITRNK